MKRGFEAAKWALTLGRERQNFLGAKWIPGFLARTPRSSRRRWALWFLSMSPHYFVHPDHPEYKDLSRKEYLEKNFEDCMVSREQIFNDLLKEHLGPDDEVLDYGCGPGFLAKAVSGHVARIYAADISPGVLACAEVLNPADNVSYLLAAKDALDVIPGESLDKAYSWAVAQHLTGNVLGEALEIIRSKLKSGGVLLLHVQLADGNWKPEEEWREDGSLSGRIKFRYGLHCFGRSKSEYRELLAEAGFEVDDFVALSDRTTEGIESIEGQCLIVASRS